MTEQQNPQTTPSPAPDQTALAKLVAAALKDPAFRAQLNQDPKATAASMGIELSDEMAQAISGHADAGAEELEQRVSKFWGGGAPAQPNMGGLNMGGSNLTTVAPFR